MDKALRQVIGLRLVAGALSGEDSKIRFLGNTNWHSFRRSLTKIPKGRPLHITFLDDIVDLENHFHDLRRQQKLLGLGNEGVEHMLLTHVVGA